MEGVIPWQVLLSHIEPHYPKTGRRGRQPMALGNMFRIYCLQNWFNLSDRQMEDALYEIESMRWFAGFSGVTDALPDETTILNFRHLLEQHEFEEGKAMVLWHEGACWGRCGLRGGARG